MLTNNQRTHIVILRDGRKFNITKSQYADFKLGKQDGKRSDSLEIKDADTKEMLYDGEIGDIKEFKQRKLASTFQGTVWFCSFGRPHPLHMQGECDCSLEFDCLPIVFKSRLIEMGYNVPSDREITEEMRFTYKQKYNPVQREKKINKNSPEEIKKIKMEMYNFFKSLPEYKQVEIEEQAWDKVYTTKPNFKENKFEYAAKALQVIAKNMIINKLIK